MGLCGGQNDKVDDADCGSIERRVQLDDRPWSGKWCLRTEIVVVGYFVLMAVLMAAMGAPKYETNARGEIEGVHPVHEAAAKKCCDAAVEEFVWAWQSSEMCVEMVANDQWSPPDYHTGARRLASKRRTPKPQNVNAGVRRLQLRSDSRESESQRDRWRRRLTIDSTQVWEGFALHPGIPLGVLAVIMALCGGFLKLMEKFAKTVLFGTFLAEAAFCLYLAFAGKWELGRAIVFSAFALAIGIYVVVMRRKIIKAGDCISVASNALLSMPSLMATVYGWMLASVALVVVLIAVAIASGNHSVVNQGSETGLSSNPYNMTSRFEKYKYPTCDWKAQGGWSLVAFTLFLIWKWMWAYLVMVQVCFVSGCVAQFNFERSLVTKSMPLTLIKLAFTKSAGTVGKSALVLQFIDFVKKHSKLSCRNCATCCCTWPVIVVACVLRGCCFACLEMMNKFVLIFHVITGDEFWKSATRSYKLMKKAGLDALVMETAALNTFVIIGYGLSLGVGVFTWWWAGVEYGKDVLGDEDKWGEEDSYTNGWSEFMLWIMIILMLMPTFAIFLIVIIAMSVGNDMVRCWIPWCCGVFCGAICAKFFWQTVNALLVASNATFVCIAIDKVNNVAEPADKDNRLYALARADIVTAIELAKAEATGTAKVGDAGPTATAVLVTTPAPQTVPVQIPPDAAPGATLTVPLPDGRTVQVVVPPGTAPGVVIQVAVPP